MTLINEQVNKLEHFSPIIIQLEKLAHGELYSKERLHCYIRIDNPDCSKCGNVETLKHKFVECPYARAIWTKALSITDRIKTIKDSNEPLA